MIWRFLLGMKVPNCKDIDLIFQTEILINSWYKIYLNINTILWPLGLKNKGLGLYALISKLFYNV